MPERLACEVMHKERYIKVILELIMKKCIPVLLYGLEVCDLPKRTIQSLDFSVNRVLMKLFRSSNIEIIAECRNHFGA